MAAIAGPAEETTTQEAETGQEVARRDEGFALLAAPARRSRPPARPALRTPVVARDAALLLVETNAAPQRVSAEPEREAPAPEEEPGDADDRAPLEAALVVGLL